MKGRIPYFFRFAPIIFLLIASSCSRRQYHDDTPVLAKVGDVVITEKSFIESYSFGPSFLKSVDGAKESYLQAMINEAVLAQLPQVQEKKSGEYVQKSMRLLKQELLVEKMFNVEVGGKVSVSEEEIREAIARSAIENRVKYLYTDDLNEARRFKAELDSGADFDSLLENKLGHLGIAVENGETDFIGYGELQEPFNETIYCLKPSEISPIISHGKGYFIIKKVASRRRILAESDFAQYRHRYEQVIRYKKDRRQTGRFLKEFMDPKEVVVDGKIFNVLARTFHSLIHTAIQDSGFQQTPSLPEPLSFRQISEQLADYYDEPAVRFKDGHWTVRELLYHLSYRPLDLRAAEFTELAGKLRTIIGRTIRDVCLEEEALKRNYDRDPEIRYQLDRWERKHTTQVFIDSVKNICQPELSNVESLYEKTAYAQNVEFDQVVSHLTGLLTMKMTQDRLMELAESSEIEVILHPEHLNAVRVDEPRAGRLPDVKLYKLGLPYLREAFPTPDPLWGAEEILERLTRSSDEELINKKQ
ncbi:MAG: peptidylprolyl isomerase [Fidelibacterota bacterium]